MTTGGMATEPMSDLNLDRFRTRTCPRPTRLLELGFEAAPMHSAQVTAAASAPETAPIARQSKEGRRPEGRKRRPEGQVGRHNGDAGRWRRERGRGGLDAALLGLLRTNCHMAALGRGPTPEALEAEAVASGRGVPPGGQAAAAATSCALRAAPTKSNNSHQNWSLWRLDAAQRWSFERDARAERRRGATRRDACDVVGVGRRR